MGTDWKGETISMHVGMSEHNTGKSRTEKKNWRINRPKRDTTETQYDKRLTYYIIVNSSDRRY